MHREKGIDFIKSLKLNLLKSRKILEILRIRFKFLILGNLEKLEINVLIFAWLELWKNKSN